jgi:cytochrome c oxidase cbb3-type subunit III
LRALPRHISSGRALFLKNCAHCHGSDARGDEGPDLHNLDRTDEQITARIRNGKKGQMTAFAGKFSPQQTRDVVTYLRTLK